MMRVGFIPVFMLLQRRSTEDWAQNALLQYVLMAVFAFSNGYTSTLSMMLGANQKGVRKEEQEAAGAIMSLLLVFGIFSGSLLALPTQIGIDASGPMCSS